MIFCQSPAMITLSIRPKSYVCAAWYYQHVLHFCSMTTLLNLFYRLPLEFVAQCFLLISLVWVCVRHRFAHCRWLRWGMWVVLIIWVAAALWITIFGRSSGTVRLPERIPFHSYRELFASGKDEIIRTNFMNVALFYPAGLLLASLLPESWTNCRKILAVGIMLALFSLSIEYVQFSYALGKPEIDDVIHNTIGAILGTIPIVFKEILHNPTM